MYVNNLNRSVGMLCLLCVNVPSVYVLLQYMTAAAAPMQGTYIPQYTAVPASAVSVEVSFWVTENPFTGPAD